MNSESILNSTNIFEFNSKNIKFGYRQTDLPKNLIFLSASFKTYKSNKKQIEENIHKLKAEKESSQPLRVKTGGSTFKNTNGKKAWALIKESGCDKLFIGDAKISEKHCNFFVNEGKAKTEDIEKLIEKVKTEVKNKTGINLELEIKIIGNER